MLTVDFKEANLMAQKFTCRNVDDIDDVDNAEEKKIYVMLAMLTILAMLIFFKCLFFYNKKITCVMLTLLTMWTMLKKKNGAHCSDDLAAAHYRLAHAVPMVGLRPTTEPNHIFYWDYI